MSEFGLNKGTLHLDKKTNKLGKKMINIIFYVDDNKKKTKLRNIHLKNDR